jgi:hypothetical protein
LLAAFYIRSLFKADAIAGTLMKIEEGTGAIEILKIKIQKNR